MCRTSCLCGWIVFTVFYSGEKIVVLYRCVDSPVGLEGESDCPKVSCPKACIDFKEHIGP